MRQPPHITFSIENLIQNPALVSGISSSLNDGEVISDCLIVHGKKRTEPVFWTVRTMSPRAMIRRPADIMSGLTYEQSLTEAIVYVTADNLPALQVLTGHGELDETRTASMEKLLTDYNLCGVSTAARRCTPAGGAAADSLPTERPDG